MNSVVMQICASHCVSLISRLGPTGVNVTQCSDDPTGPTGIKVNYHSDVLTVQTGINVNQCSDMPTGLTSLPS